MCTTCAYAYDMNDSRTLIERNNVMTTCATPTPSDDSRFCATCRHEISRLAFTGWAHVTTFISNAEGRRRDHLIEQQMNGGM